MRNDKLTIRMTFDYSRGHNYNNLAEHVCLNIDDNIKINNLRFTQVRKIIKDYISEWSGCGIIEIINVELSSCFKDVKKNKNVQKINEQLSRNMVDKTYKFQEKETKS